MYLKFTFSMHIHESHKHDAVEKDKSLGEFNTKDSINLDIFIYFNQMKN
jgi:hypothetical protein